MPFVIQCNKVSFASYFSLRWDTYLLLAVNNVVLAIGGLLSSRRDVTDIRSSRRLRDSKADSLVAAENLGDDLLLEELRGVLLEGRSTDGLQQISDSAQGMYP